LPFAPYAVAIAKGNNKLYNKTRVLFKLCLFIVVVVAVVAL
jgi:hypothetical protein